MFTDSAPLDRVSHRVAISVCMSVCAIRCSFMGGLSWAQRSHDQFQGLSLPFLYIFFRFGMSATIRIGQKIQCLLYAGFWFYAVLGGNPTYGTPLNLLKCADNSTVTKKVHLIPQK